MVIANECTRHICCSRKNSFSCAKSTSIGRNKNKLLVGSANAQINPAMTTWGRFISGSWCGLKRVRQWRSWSGSKGFSPACLCHSIMEYTVKVAPFPLSLGNYLYNRIEFINSEMKGNGKSVLQYLDSHLKNNNAKSNNSPSLNGLPNHLLLHCPFIFLKALLLTSIWYFRSCSAVNELEFRIVKIFFF